ncbi:MAG: hypothetical protein ACKVX7_01015 [Planctomycetota bacterium]
MMRAMTTLCLACALAFVYVLSAAPRQLFAIDASTEPPTPASPGAEVGALAVAAARAEIDTLTTQFAAETRALGERITAETAKNRELAARELELRQRIESLGRELDAFDLQIATSTIDRQIAAASEQAKAVDHEVGRQFGALRQRFKDTLLRHEHPEWLTELARLERATELPVIERVPLLLKKFEQLHQYASTSSVFLAPVQLAAAAGRIEECRVLRVGLIGGFYTHDATQVSGAVTLSEDPLGSLMGRSDAFDATRQRQIAAVIVNPQQGGSLPLDLTGGGALRTLVAQDTVKGWFDSTGPLLWIIIWVSMAAIFLLLAFGSPYGRARRRRLLAAKPASPTPAPPNAHEAEIVPPNRVTAALARQQQR